MQKAISSLVKTKPGKRDYQKEFFCENGGAFGYEFIPKAFQHGLIESKTPECVSASEVLLYQKAQERLLIQAIPLAEHALSLQGFPGKLQILKNCRDSEGHIYGAQENYEVEIAQGTSLLLLRLGLVILFPLVILLTGFMLFELTLGFAALFLLTALWFFSLLVLNSLALAATAFPGVFGSTSGYGLKAKARSLSNLASKVLNDSNFESNLMKVESYFSYVGIIFFTPFAWLWNLTGFLKQRRQLTAFFASRIIFSGAGTLLEDGSFCLAEKAVAVKSLMRKDGWVSARVLFDTGNLLKKVSFSSLNLLTLKKLDYLELFKRKQRLQYGMSDSNCAQLAEYLKIGLTQMVLELAEQGVFYDAPVLKDPIAAIKSINSDPSLKATVPLKNGQAISALELQRYYLDRVKSHFKKGAVSSLEHRELLQHWDMVLLNLEKSPDKLIGRIDWVSKKYLLHTAGDGLGYQSKKKIDLAYHQLGDGYFAILEKEHVGEKLVDEEEVQEATIKPSSASQAKRRSNYIKNPLYEGKSVIISWDCVHVGPFLTGKVISLRDYRK